MRKWWFVLVSLAVVLTLARLAGFREIGETWRSIELRGVAVAVLCTYGTMAFRFLSWRSLLGDPSISARSLAPALGLGIVLGNVAPAKSGEPVTAVLVSRAIGVPLSRTVSVLVAERALQLMVLLATFIPGAIFYAGSIAAVSGAVRGAGIALAVLTLGLLFAPRALRWIAARIAGWRVGATVAEYLEALAALLSEGRRMIPPVALATGFWLLQYVSLWSILDAGGLDVNLGEVAVVVGTAILGGTLSLLPLGTQDGISAVVLGGLGVPLAQGFALALFHTLLSLTCGLVVLVVAPLLLKTRA